MTLGRRLLDVPALVLLLSFSPLLLESAVAALISITPTQGILSSLVIVSGSEWPKGDMVDLYWNFDEKDVTIASIKDNASGPFIARIRADEKGVFTTTVVVRKGAPSGKTHITAGDQAAFLTAQAPFEVLADEPPICADAYFIGAHGTTEGPDGPNRALSKTIGETWENFYELATKAGKKNVKGYAIDYPGATFQVISTFPYSFGVTDLGTLALEGTFQTIKKYCKTPPIVLAGYSLGAWVIEKWIAMTPADHLNYIRSVEVYGDPLWYRALPTSGVSRRPDNSAGIARRLGKVVPLDPYMQTPPGYAKPLMDRWQSICLPNDPICGEGYSLGLLNVGRQVIDTANCNPCEHWKYMTLSPKRDLSGYGSTKGGAAFLASKAFQ